MAFCLLNYNMQVLETGQYSGEVAGVCGGAGLFTSLTTYDSKSFNGALHYHENAHFSFVLNGGCIEKKHVSYSCLPGKLQYYSAGEPHQVTQILPASRRINLEIEDGFFKHYRVSDQDLQNATENPEAKFLMIRIYRELMAGDVASPVSIQMLLLQLISQTSTSRPNGQVPHWTNTVRTILQDRWNEKVTLTELSLESNVHPVTISRYFSAYFSCTLGEYMRKIKVEKALCLIKSSALPLTEIAYSCGFADQSHFIRSFKEFTGCLPTAYRRY